MKYKNVKEITIKRLVSDGVCQTALDFVIKKYGSYGFLETIPWDEESENFAIEIAGISWLIENGYIKKVEEEIKYDPYTVYIWDSGFRDYKLHKNINDSYTWIDLTSSTCHGTGSHKTPNEAFYRATNVYECSSVKAYYKGNYKKIK